MSTADRLHELLAALNWSQRQAAWALHCRRGDVRRALSGVEPWASVLTDACAAVVRVQEELHARLQGQHGAPEC